LYIVFSTYKNTIQLLSYQIFSTLVSFSLFFYVFFANFAAQPDEETGSAEEQPASNMAVPTLEAVFQEPPRPWAAYRFLAGLSAKKTLPAYSYGMPQSGIYKAGRSRLSRVCWCKHSNLSYILLISGIFLVVIGIYWSFLVARNDHFFSIHITKKKAYICSVIINHQPFCWGV